MNNIIGGVIIGASFATGVALGANRAKKYMKIRAEIEKKLKRELTPTETKEVIKSIILFKEKTIVNRIINNGKKRKQKQE